MLNMIIGAVVISALWLIVSYTNRKGLQVAWWQWLLTILGLVLAALTLASVATFINEGAPKAALIIGGILGLTVIVWGALMGRFVFLRSNQG